MVIKRIVNWIETGDLIPAILLVSVPHYISVLWTFDYWPVAVAVGFLMDIGHYRAIKLAMRGGSWAWMWVAILTVAVFGFHVWFYFVQDAGWFGALLLGSVPPLLIGFLAFLTRKEKLDMKLSRAVSDESHGNPTGIPREPHEKPNPKLGSYQEYVRLNESRNGEGVVSAQDLVGKYGIAKSTAYRWYSQYAGAQRESAN